MDSDVDVEIDKREGSFFQTITQPAVLELSRLWAMLNDAIAISLYMYANGIYLDYHGAQVGLTRKDSSSATGTLQITGDNGTIIPSGTRFSTASLTETDTAQRFLSGDSQTISGGTATVEVTAEIPGADGNVSADSVTIVEDSIAGIATVNNDEAMTGGADVEDDDDFRSRIAIQIASPQGAGNSSDYIAWARSRDSVGPDVTVVPRWNGVNNVKVIISDDDGNPSSTTVMQDVQDYLTGTHRIDTPDTAPSDDGTAAGSLTGSYEYRVTITDIFGCETAGSPALAVTLTADSQDLADLPLGNDYTYSRKIYRSIASGPFYLLTEITDNFTTTYTDNGAVDTDYIMPKTNNTSFCDGIAPIGANVWVDTPTLVDIDIAATVVFAPGYSLDGSGGTTETQTAIEAALVDYVDALPAGGDVYYRHVEAQFFAVTGVLDVTGLLVNGGTSNITLEEQEVSVVGTITLV